MRAWQGYEGFLIEEISIHNALNWNLKEPFRWRRKAHFGKESPKKSGAFHSSRVFAPHQGVLERSVK